MGSDRFPRAQEFLITADGGGAATVAVRTCGKWRCRNWRTIWASRSGCAISTGNQEFSGALTASIALRHGAGCRAGLPAGQLDARARCRRAAQPIFDESPACWPTFRPTDPDYIYTLADQYKPRASKCSGADVDDDEPRNATRPARAQSSTVVLWLVCCAANAVTHLMCPSPTTSGRLAQGSSAPTKCHELTQIQDLEPARLPNGNAHHFCNQGNSLARLVWGHQEASIDVSGFCDAT